MSPTVGCDKKTDECQKRSQSEVFFAIERPSQSLKTDVKIWCARSENMWYVGPLYKKRCGAHPISSDYDLGFAAI